MSTLPAIRAPALPDLAARAVAGYSSPHTRRVYAARIRLFAASGLPLTREGVREWIARVRDQPASPQVVNQSIKAIKALVEEALIRGLIGEQEARLIADLHYVREIGVRMGNWLSRDDAARLVALPDRSTLKGKRDAAIFALLLGCGLRRAEACELVWEQYQQREGRQVLVDVRGKGGRVRTVPVASWAERDLDAWELAVHHEGVPRLADEDTILVGFPRHYDYPDIYRPLGPGGVWKIVKGYAEKMGGACGQVRPHDLRRTLAQLMRKARVEIEQISATLGHESIVTTQRYLGVGMELGKGKAGVDKVEL